MVIFHSYVKLPEGTQNDMNPIGFPMTLLIQYQSSERIMVFSRPKIPHFVGEANRIFSRVPLGP